MINRLMEKKTELFPEEYEMSFKDPMKLEYYLIESNLEDLDELSGKKVYGIEIVKKVDGMEDEKEIVRNLSCSIENTKEVLDKLVKNNVTPITLPFILDDLLGA